MDIDERQISFLRQPEPPKVQITGNETLANACNRLLLMVERDPTLLNGDSFGQIDRRIFGEILWEDGLNQLIPSDKKQEFLNTIQKCPESDVFTRARRELLARDLIRVNSKAIKSAEQFRSRIASSMR
jgi:hypothetical protein